MLYIYTLYNMLLSILLNRTSASWNLLLRMTSVGPWQPQHEIGEPCQNSTLAREGHPPGRMSAFDNVQSQTTHLGCVIGILSCTQTFRSVVVDGRGLSASSWGSSVILAGQFARSCVDVVSWLFFFVNSSQFRSAGRTWHWLSSCIWNSRFQFRAALLSSLSFVLL